MDVNEFKNWYTGPGIKNYVRKREMKPQWLQEDKIVGEFLERYPNRTVADIPVGTGRFMKYYAKNNNKVIGLDVSPDMLEQARSEAALCNVTSPRLELADLFAINPADYRADIVVCLRFLNHLDREWVPRALKALASVGGEAVIASFLSIDPQNVTPEQLATFERKARKKKLDDHLKDKQRVYLKSDFEGWIGDLGLKSSESRNVTVTPSGSSLDVYLLTYQ